MEVIKNAVQMEEPCFISVENMDSVYDISDIVDFQGITYTLYQFFTKNENEVAYFVKDGYMYGILSIGDLERYYRKYAKELVINREYTYLNTIDYKEATDFFNRIKTVCEVPVVSETNVFLGVISRAKDEGVRKQQKVSLRNARVLYYKRQCTEKSWQDLSIVQKPEYFFIVMTWKQQEMHWVKREKLY